MIYLQNENKLYLSYDICGGSMSRITNISHPIIKSYVEDFVKSNEISDEEAKDQHNIFECFTNALMLSIYSNDQSVTYQDMETGTAFGVDGVAIFVSDRLVTSTEDVDSLIEEVRKFDVSFLFTQVKTSDKFNRQDISDFLLAVKRFFNFSKCEISELSSQWEVVKYIYTKSAKFKKPPLLNLKYVCLSPKEIDLADPHLASSIEAGISSLNDLTLFNEIKSPEFLGIKEIMILHEKVTSGLEVSVKLSKPLVSYPRDAHNKIKNGYYGLIRLDEFESLLVDDVDGIKVLRKGIFNDNIRFYLGSLDKIEVNANMKKQLTGEENYLFGLLNNGITIIADSVSLNSEEVTLTNYQIVNGCQTSNVIFECLESIAGAQDIYIPIRLIATEDEDAKQSIIVATNSQTPLKQEQLVALKSIQKALELFYSTKSQSSICPLYYERRTEQYRDENIPRSKIINIPFQIKSTSALFFNLPHEVSGQYGKVERNTRGLLFEDSHTQFLNSYYVSGLAWYKVERFISSQDEGKKYRRARWHIIMLLKYLCCPHDKIATQISKQSEHNSALIEAVLLDDDKATDIMKQAVTIIEESLNVKDQTDVVLSDRKIFERKETTNTIIEYIRKSEH
jgi:hypothetical protein